MDAKLVPFRFEDKFQQSSYSGLIVGLCPANEEQRYFVTMSLIGWAQA